jgi:hypothetical protein
MKKFVTTVALILIFVSGNALAATWVGPSTGSVKVGDTGVLFGGGSWADTTTPAELTWGVSLASGLYTYIYNFNLHTDQGAISHWILELSEDIADASTFEIISATGVEDDDSPTLWGGPSGAGISGNPGLTEDIFGIKYNLPESSEVFSMSIEILTSRVPMEGDFYAKDGDAGGSTNYFWANDVIPVPNTSEVPIPGAILLLGSGLIGLVSVRKKFKK